MARARRGRCPYCGSGGTAGAGAGVNISLENFLGMLLCKISPTEVERLVCAWNYN
jgi:hypothetical protein